MIVIDRIENGVAVCENSDTALRIPLAHIQGHPAEGDVIVPVDTGYAVDPEATQARRAKLRARLDSLTNRSFEK